MKALQHQIPFELQKVGYENYPKSEQPSPQLQELLGTDGFSIEELNNVYRVYGNGILLRFRERNANYTILIRYEPDLQFAQVINHIRIDGGCSIPNLVIKKRVQFIFETLGMETDWLKQVDVHSVIYADWFSIW